MWPTDWREHQKRMMRSKSWLNSNALCAAHLLQLVEKHGQSKWTEIAHHIPGRQAKQCRARYVGKVKCLISWKESRCNDCIIIRLWQGRPRGADQDTSEG